MSTNLKNNDATTRDTVYGSIGLAIFMICFILSYMFPNVFIEGSMFVITGILILIVNIAKIIKGIEYGGLEVLFGIVSLVAGVNKIFSWDIGFISVIALVLATSYLLRSIKMLWNGQIFD